MITVGDSEWIIIHCVYSIHVYAGVAAEDRAGAEAGQQGDHSPQKKVSRLSSAVVWAVLLRTCTCMCGCGSGKFRHPCNSHMNWLENCYLVATSCGFTFPLLLQRCLNVMQCMCCIHVCTNKSTNVCTTIFVVNLITSLSSVGCQSLRMLLLHPQSWDQSQPVVAATRPSLAPGHAHHPLALPLPTVRI